MLIKKKLPLMFISLITASMLLVCIIIYNYSSQSLINNSKRNISTITKLESDVFTELINKQKLEVELSSQRADVITVLKKRANDKTDKFINSEEAVNLSKSLKKNAEFTKSLEHSFVVDLNGKIISDSNIIIKADYIGDRAYFKEAVNGNVNIGDTVYSKIDGKPVNVFATPVKDEYGKIIGVYCNSFYADYFQKFTDNIKVGKNGYAYIIDNNSNLVAYPDKSKIGNKFDIAGLNQIVNDIKNKKESEIGLSTYEYNGEKKYVGYSFIPDLKWTLFVVQNINEVNDPAKNQLFMVIIIFIIIYILSIIAGLTFAKSITDPISQIINTVDHVSQGDLDSRCNYNSSNELGILSNNFNIMINELKKNREELAISEERYKNALSGINDVVWVYNPKAKEFFASEKWFEITEFDLSKRPIKDFFLEYVPEIYRHELINNLKKHKNGHSEFFRSEFKLISEKGREKWILIKGKALTDEEGNVLEYTGTMTDNTNIRNAEERIKKLAFYDSLTNLPNRNTFIKELNKQFEKCIKNNTFSAVLFIDIDDFKKINDSLGHNAGDLLLQRVSLSMSRLIGNDDVIGRFGGDEFLILIRNVRNKEELTGYAKNVLNIFENNFELEGSKIFITASIGISILPVDGENTNIILKNSDTAMYYAKENGKNKFAFYNENMSNILNRNLQIERMLRFDTLRRNLYAEYQPMVELKTGKIIGVEALLRLRNDELGQVNPNEFIPIAEKTGLILPIGNWIMKTACEQEMKWIKEGWNNIRVSINVSSLQIKEKDFINKVIDNIHKLRIPTENVVIEITESVLMESLEHNSKVLTELRKHGIRTCLDDFGTGYSSLNYLRSIPINTLKIDKSFVDDICINKNQESVVEGIIQLAHKMNIDVVAEGVEGTEQLELLKKMGCDIIQGYIFSKPEPADKISEVLNNVFFFNN